MNFMCFYQYYLIKVLINMDSKLSQNSFTFHSNVCHLNTFLYIKSTFPIEIGFITIPLCLIGKFLQQAHVQYKLITYFNTIFIKKQLRSIYQSVRRTVSVEYSSDRQLRRFRINFILCIIIPRRVHMSDFVDILSKKLRICKE